MLRFGSVISTELLKKHCIAIYIKPGPKTLLIVPYFYFVTNNAYRSITNNPTPTPTLPPSK